MIRICIQSLLAIRRSPIEDANKGINVTSHVTINIEPPQVPKTETIPLEIYESNFEWEQEGKDKSSKNYSIVSPKVKSYYADIISEFELKHGKENIPY